MDSDDEFGDLALKWDDDALEQLDSIESRPPSTTQDVKPAPRGRAAPPHVQAPRPSQLPPQQRGARPPPTRPLPSHQLQQRPTGVPHPAPSQLASVVPLPSQTGGVLSGTQYLGPAPRQGILRPPRPPPRSTQNPREVQARPQQQDRSTSRPENAAATEPATSRAGPAPTATSKRHPRQSLNALGEPGYVDPNPFAGRAHPSTATDSSVAEGSRRADSAPHAPDGAAKAPRLADDDEEDLPAIAFDEQGGGGYRAAPHRDVTIMVTDHAVSRTAQVPPSVAGLSRPEERAGSTERVDHGPSVPSATTMTVQGVDRQELEQLRMEREQLAKQLALARKTQEQLERQVMTKTGENSVVRQRLSKAEAAHMAALRAEQRDKALLQEQLEAREREFLSQLERFKMEDAFRRQELATTAGPGSASSQRAYLTHPNHPSLSSARSARFYSRASSRAHAPATSPSVDRAGRAPLVEGQSDATRPRASSRAATEPVERPSVAIPAFAGFQSAFGPPSSPSHSMAVGKAGPAARRNEVDGEQGDGREGSMGPPKKRTAGREKDPPNDSVAAAPRTKRRKGPNGEDVAANDQVKGRMLLVPEEGEDDGTGADLGGFEHAEVPLNGAQGEDGAWAWVAEDRDSRSELLAALFTHTTLGTIDVEPAAVPPTAQSSRHMHGPQRPTATARPATGSRYFTSARSVSSAHRGRHAPSAAPVPDPATTGPPGPVPTFHALMNLRFPATTPPALVTTYQIQARELFSLLGRRLDPHAHASSAQDPAQFALLPPHLALSARPEDLETALLAAGLVRCLTRLLVVLEQATLVGPITALLRLLSHLVFLFPPVAHACCAGQRMSPEAKEAAEKDESLVTVLARIIVRYTRPDVPSKDQPAAAAAAAMLGAGAAGRGATLRSRKARIARPNLTAAGRRRGVRIEDEGLADAEMQRVQLEPDKRARLIEAVTSVLEGVAWRCLAVTKSMEAGPDGDGGRAAEEAFIAFLKTPYAVATLLDPNHPIGTLLLGTRLLALLACRPALFRSLLASKFYDGADLRASKLPFVDRIATLLVMPRPESHSGHVLDLTLLSLTSLLLSAHEDAVMLVAQAASFVPELLGKIWRDVRTLWEWDGREAAPGSSAREMLNRVTVRLSASMHIIGYLALAPHSSLSVSDLLAGPTSAVASAGGGGGGAGGGGGGAGAAPDGPVPAPAYARQAVNDLFMVALGTIGFATLDAEDGPGPPAGEGDGTGEDGDGSMPSWAEPGSEQRRTLCELGYLAQEILEDVSPLELEEIEVCFAPPGESQGQADDGERGLAEGEEVGEDERQLAGAEEGL